MALERDSKPFSNALDICKPLIEDGPGGTIALIHSTLPSYVYSSLTTPAQVSQNEKRNREKGPRTSDLYSFLLDSRSGPSISAQIAHEHIALACVSHMLQILEFAKPDFQNEKMTEAVGLGCLGLQRYSSEHWTSHILNYTKLADTELNPESPLIRQTIRLSERHEILSRTITLCVNENAQVLASPSTNDTWLQRLAPFPGVCDLIFRVQTFQKVFSAQQLLEGPGMETSAPS